MSALTPPAEVRITPQARLLFRSMLIEDEKYDIIGQHEYLALDKALSSDAVFLTRDPIVESPAHGKHFCIELKVDDGCVYCADRPEFLRFPYYVRAEYLISATIPTE